jgi:signal transduction histidine kinase
MGFSDLLTRNYESFDDLRRKEFLQLIKDSSTSAYNLLENLLNWSRTQTNNIKYLPSNINISQILIENIQIHSVIAQNKEIEIRHDIPDNLLSFSDGNMINTVVLNLLTNALKFTPKGGKIDVNAKALNDHISVSIIDSGMGMDQNAMDKLFRIDEFHNTTGTEGETGTGLGLIICQEFISRHGGKIDVESQVGKGSIFRFNIPAAQS